MTSVKKIVLGIILAVVILFIGGIVLVGIDFQAIEEGSTPHKEGSESSSSIESTSKQHGNLILSIGETAKSSNEQVTVFTVQKIKTYEYYSEIFENDQSKTSSPGNTFILADTEIKNIGSNSAFTGSMRFSMTDSKGFKYDPEFYLGNDGLDLAKELFENQKMRGKILFQVPESATGLKLQYDFGDFIVGTKLATWVV